MAEGGRWARRKTWLRMRAAGDTEGYANALLAWRKSSSPLYDASLIGLIRYAPIPLIPVAKYSDLNDFQV